MVPDLNWPKILDPDPNSMYLDPQHWFLGCQQMISVPFCRKETCACHAIMFFRPWPSRFTWKSRQLSDHLAIHFAGSGWRAQSRRREKLWRWSAPAPSTPPSLSRMAWSGRQSVPFSFLVVLTHFMDQIVYTGPFFYNACGTIILWRVCYIFPTFSLFMFFLSLFITVFVMIFLHAGKVHFMYSLFII